MKDEARAGDAGLALVVEDGEGAALDGGGQVGVVDPTRCFSTRTGPGDCVRSDSSFVVKR